MATAAYLDKIDPPVMGNPEASMSSQPVKRLNSDFATSEGTFSSLARSYGCKEPISIKNSILTKLAQNRAALYRKSQSSGASEASPDPAVTAQTSHVSPIGLVQSHVEKAAVVQAQGGNPFSRLGSQGAFRHEPFSAPVASSEPNANRILAELALKRIALHEKYQVTDPAVASAFPKDVVALPVALRYLANGLVDIAPRPPTEFSSASSTLICATSTRSLALAPSPNDAQNIPSARPQFNEQAAQYQHVPHGCKVQCDGTNRCVDGKFHDLQNRDDSVIESLEVVQHSHSQMQKFSGPSTLPSRLPTSGPVTRFLSTKVDNAKDLDRNSSPTSVTRPSQDHEKFEIGVALTNRRKNSRDVASISPDQQNMPPLTCLRLERDSQPGLTQMSSLQSGSIGAQLFDSTSGNDALTTGSLYDTHHILTGTTNHLPKRASGGIGGGKHTSKSRLSHGRDSSKSEASVPTMDLSRVMQRRGHRNSSPLLSRLFSSILHNHNKSEQSTNTRTISNHTSRLLATTTQAQAHTQNPCANSESHCSAPKAKKQKLHIRATSRSIEMQQFYHTQMAHQPLRTQKIHHNQIAQQPFQIQQSHHTQPAQQPPQQRSRADINRDYETLLEQIHRKLQPKTQECGGDKEEANFQLYETDEQYRHMHQRYQQLAAQLRSLGALPEIRRQSNAHQEYQTQYPYQQFPTSFFNAAPRVLPLSSSSQQYQPPRASQHVLANSFSVIPGALQQSTSNQHYQSISTAQPYLSPFTGVTPEILHHSILIPQHQLQSSFQQLPAHTNDAYPGVDRHETFNLYDLLQGSSQQLRADFTTGFPGIARQSTSISNHQLQGSIQQPPTGINYTVLETARQSTLTPQNQPQGSSQLLLADSSVEQCMSRHESKVQGRHKSQLDLIDLTGSDEQSDDPAVHPQPKKPVYKMDRAPNNIFGDATWFTTDGKQRHTIDRWIAYQRELQYFEPMSKISCSQPIDGLFTTGHEHKLWCEFEQWYDMIYPVLRSQPPQPNPPKTKKKKASVESEHEADPSVERPKKKRKKTKTRKDSAFTEAEAASIEPDLLPPVETENEPVNDDDVQFMLDIFEILPEEAEEKEKESDGELFGGDVNLDSLFRYGEQAIEDEFMEEVMEEEYVEQEIDEESEESEESEEE